MKLKVSVSTGRQGSKQEDELDIPDEDLEGKTSEEREKIFQESAEQWLWNTIDFSWSEDE